MQQNNESKRPAVSIFSGWLMVFFSGFFYGYQFILRVSPNMMTDELMQAFSVDATQLGVFTSCYYMTYAAVLIPLGIAMDKWGPRPLFAISGAICAAGCFIFASTNSALWASIGRLLMGAGAATGFLGTLKVGTLWLPSKHFGKVIALTLTLGTLGAVMGGTPLEFFLNAVGWRSSMHGLGAIGLLLSFILWFMLRPSEEQEEKLDIKKGLKQVIASPQAWISSLYGMFMYTPLIIVGDLWGVSFLERLYGIEESEAAPMVSALFIGIALGSPCFAFFSDYMKKRKFPMILSSLLCLITYSSIFYLDSIPMSVMYGMFFAVGFFFGGKALGFATIVEVLPARISGLALGFANMVIMTSGITALPIVGYLLDAHKLHFHQESTSGQIIEMASYSLSNFRFAMLFIPFVLTLSTILSFFIKETYPSEH